MLGYCVRVPTKKSYDKLQLHVPFVSSIATEIWTSCGFEATYQTDKNFFLAVEEDPTIMHTFLVAWLKGTQYAYIV